MTRYGGVDRRRSVVLDGDGSDCWTTRIDDDPVTLGLEIEKPVPSLRWCWRRRARASTGNAGPRHTPHGGQYRAQVVMGNSVDRG